MKKIYLEFFKPLFRELLGDVGFILAAYGVYELNRQAAFIIAGSVLFYLASPKKGKTK